MYGFNKIVLSRKGFDSSAGGGYSPFNPEKRKYIWLPIPEKKSIATGMSNELKFEDITIEDNYLPRYGASNLKELLERFSEGRKNRDVSPKLGTWEPTLEKKGTEYTHFDPWLKDGPWLKEESKHSLGAFGQVGRAQTILTKQGVGENTLFLFFSRFVPVPKRKNDDLEIDIENKYSREHLNDGLYFIYGWFKVGEIIRKFEEIDKKIPNPKLGEELKSRHPHATESYFNKKQNNTIYIADELLFPDDTIPGCGYFPTLSDKQLLTATDSAQHEVGSWIPSRWKTPPGFSLETCCPSSPLRLANWVSAKEGAPLVETVIKERPHWQEAAFDETEEFCDWFKELLPEMHP